MSWSKSDWFGLWTSLAVTGGFVISGITYLLARRQARIVGPNLQVPQVSGKGGSPRHHIQLNIEPPDHTRWRIVEVCVKEPESTRIGIPPLKERNDYLTAAADGKCVTFPPEIHTAHLIADQLGPSILSFEVRVALRTNPKVISRLITHAKIPN